MLLISAHVSDTKCALGHMFHWYLLCKLNCLWPSSKDRHWILILLYWNCIVVCYAQKRFFWSKYRGQDNVFEWLQLRIFHSKLKKRVGNPIFLTLSRQIASMYLRRNQPVSPKRLMVDIAEKIFLDFFCYLTEWEIFCLPGLNKWPLLIYRI